MRTIKNVGRNHIFSPLCLVKALHNKGKRNYSRVCHSNKELTAGFTRFYQIVYWGKIRHPQVPEGVHF